MPNVTLSFSVPMDKAQEIENMILLAKKELKKNATFRCTQGKTLYYLVLQGYHQLKLELEQRAIEAEKRAKKVSGDNLRVEEEIIHSDES